MRAKKLQPIILLVVLLSWAVLPCPGQAQGLKFDEFKRRLEREFGHQLNDSPLLYNINENYILEVDREETSAAFSLQVFPKHYLEDLSPEWKEPNYTVELTMEEYANILSKIGSVRNIGHLVTEGKVGTVSNTTLWLVDRFDGAYIEKGLYRTFDDSNKEKITVRSFNVYYIRKVKGVVEDKPDGAMNIGGTTKLKVSGHWYFVDDETADRIQVGQTIQANLAGPIDVLSQGSE